MLPVFIRNFACLREWYGIRFGSAGDIACGPGHFAAFLRSYGVPVFGTDISAAMIHLARRWYGHQGIDFFIQDMRDLKLPRKVDLLTCNFDSLNYLVRQGDLYRTLRAFGRNLNPWGHLIFDSITHVGRDPGIAPHALRFELPGRVSTWVVHCNPRTGIRTVWMGNVDNTKGDRRKVTLEHHQQRAWPIGKIAELLQRLGFRIKSVRSGNTLAIADGKTRRAVFLAQRFPSS